MEFVFVVPRERLFPSFYPRGLVRFGAGSADLELQAFEEALAEHGFFVERAYAERSPGLQQIIPYSVVSARGKILLMRRLNKGGEDRLFDKLSVGVGGHINPEDDGARGRNAQELLENGTRREIQEEIDVQGPWSAHPIGLINDDSNSVGAVHVGLLQVVTVDGTVAIREEDVLEGRLVPPGELKKLFLQKANFETWSSIVIESLDEFVTQPIPVTT